MQTTAYDGTEFVSHDEKYDNPLACAENHRRKVRWHLRRYDLCRLPDNHDLLSKDKR